VHLAAKRVRQVREGAELLVPRSKNGDVVTVLREIAAGRIKAEPGPKTPGV
jgi:DNA-directed RNA polymerase subunit omega